MQQVALALLLGVSLAVGAAPAHGHATALPGYQPAPLARGGCRPD